MRPKIELLLAEVKKLEEKSRLAAEKSGLSANEASGGLISSYSAAGDVEHARNTANLSKLKAGQLKKLKEEIESAVGIEAPETVKAVCFVSVKFNNGGIKDFYFVENPTYLPGFNLISESSPIGKSLKGKSCGQHFSYNAGEQKFEGEVLEIG